jgi:DNA polymerase zeta
VDEKRILRFMNDEDDDFPYDSDEEAMREIELSQKRTIDKGEEKHLDSKDIGQLEHDIDDESRPGGEQCGEQFLDPRDPNIFEDSAGSSSVVAVKAADVVKNPFESEPGAAGSSSSQDGRR